MATEQEHLQDLERIKNFRLMDDNFFHACMKDNIEAAQLILRIVLEDDSIQVKHAFTQEEVKNLFGHSLYLDLFAVDIRGSRYDCEIQRSDAGACPERAEYHCSTLDANSLPAGEQDFRKKKASFTIFITENDIYEAGLPVYHIEPIVKELNRPFGGKARIIYVNGAYDDGGQSAIGQLMRDFRCSEPDEMYFCELATRVRHFKKEKEGVNTMCRELEKMRAESEAKGEARGRAEGSLNRIVAAVKDLMRNGKMPAAEAMDLLSVSSEERKLIVPLL